MSTAAFHESWPLRQLIKLEHAQPALVQRALQRALQRLLAEDAALRWSLVVSAYLDEEVSLARAASLLGLHPLELREQFQIKGIPLLLGPVDEADAQAEIEALRAWKRATGADAP